LQFVVINVTAFLGRQYTKPKEKYFNSVG